MTPNNGNKLLDPISWEDKGNVKMCNNSPLTNEPSNKIKQPFELRKELISELTKDELLNVIGDALISKLSHTPSKHTSTPCSITTDIINTNNNTNTDMNTSTNEHNSKISPSSNSKSPECSDNSTNSILNLLESQHINQFNLPVDNIIQKINDIQNLVSLLGNKNKKLEIWYNSLISIFDNFINDLNNDRKKMSLEFVKSLETITKIFSITSKFSPIETINESVLTPSIRNLIMDFNSNSFTNLENYCNDSLSMYTLNKDVEENLTRLIPILSQQLLTFNKQLKKFYSIYELVDDYDQVDQNFLNQIPTKQDITLFGEINEATNIKQILQTNFSEINPSLISQLDNEIETLNQFILERLKSLKELIMNVVTINNELFTINDDEFMKVPSFINNNELIISKIGVKSNVFNEYEQQLLELQKEKNKRQQCKKEYLQNVEQLWSILRPQSDEIQNFLKINNNLFKSSLENFENLLDELNQEKLTNIKKFIQISREKISGFWEILMYDDESRFKFKEFFINDTHLFDEELLNIHSNELEKLRKETENLKPLLNLISQLNVLIEEKKQLDESSKDPSRLLKRNSFKILKQEEKTRDKLAKRFPLVISEIKQKIKNFEAETGRLFKLNGESYINTLEEIENLCTHSRKPVRSSVNSPASTSRNRNNSSRNTSRSSSMKRSNKVIKPRPMATPSNSVIRKRDLSELTNPFLSKNSSPLKRQKTSYATPSSVSTNNPVSKSPGSLSNKPIILRGGSPVRRLNFKGSTKLSINKSIPIPILSAVNKQSNSIPQKPSNNLKIRSPMGMIKGPTINSRIPIFSENKLNQNSVPVEELSDLTVDYSDNDTIDKENQNPVTQKSKEYLNSNIKNTSLSHAFNLSFDSETF